MLGYKIVALVLVAISLAANYSLDQGKHIKAKTIHAICVALLAFNYATSPLYLGRFLGNTNKHIKALSVPVGIIPANLHAVFFVVYLCLCMVMVLLIFRLVKRNEKARQHLLYFMPVMVLAETVSFYIGWASGGGDLVLNHGLIFFTGFGITAILGALIMIAYSSNVMKAFFTPPPAYVEEVNNEEINTPEPDL